MDFKCATDPNHKFSLEPPEDKKGVAWAWKGAVKCPYCGSADLQHVFTPAVLNSGVDLNKARKENREATIMAQRLAGEARQKELRERPEVSLTPIQGSGRFGGDTIKIKKDVFEALRQATPDSAKIAGGGDVTPI